MKDGYVTAIVFKNQSGDSLDYLVVVERYGIGLKIPPIPLDPWRSPRVLRLARQGRKLSFELKHAAEAGRGPRLIGLRQIGGHWLFHCPAPCQREQSEANQGGHTQGGNLIC